MNRIFVYGFPGLYGGAGTELHHQIIAWRHMGMEVHIIPSDEGYMGEPLYAEMLERNVTVHTAHEFSAMSAEDPILSFCSGDFLERLAEIRQHTKRTVFVNCMTWLFEKEKEGMAKGEIAMFLFQNELVRQKNMPALQAINPDAGAVFLTFKPYFENHLFDFVAERPAEYFGCGRISRQDTDKFAANTLHIYEYFVAPVMKSGLFLGFDHRSEAKIGKPFDWIRTAFDHTVVSQAEFYRHCEIILQPTDTTENWPRVGFEAMASGSVLIVDNRGGWQQMVRHGETGWLCNHERDFIYYASKMAYEPNLRREMAERAREHALNLGGLRASMDSWAEVFAAIQKLPV
jgi:hypothetical protein